MDLNEPCITYTYFHAINNEQNLDSLNHSKLGECVISKPKKNCCCIMVNVESKRMVPVMHIPTAIGDHLKLARPIAL